MKKFFEIVSSDIKKMWRNNKLQFLIIGILLLLSLLVIIVPGLEAFLMIILKIVGIILLAVFCILFGLLIGMYIKNTIERIKEK